jgi:hypothetical protein
MGRMLSFCDPADRDRMPMVAWEILDRMHRAIRNGTVEPIMAVFGHGIVGMTDEKGRGDPILHIDGGSGEKGCATMEEFVAVADSCLLAMGQGPISIEEERTVRRAMVLIGTIEAHAETVAKGREFPILTTVMAPTPWHADIIVNPHVPPLPVFGRRITRPIDHVLPMLVTIKEDRVGEMSLLEAVKGDDGRGCTLHSITTMSVMVTQEPSTIDLLRASAELQALEPLIRRMGQGG